MTSVALDWRSIAVRGVVAIAFGVLAGGRIEVRVARVGREATAGR